jgi:hypothetical protein
MGHSILASLGHGPGISPTDDTMDSHCVTLSIFGLANGIQAILEDALAEATTMFPHKPLATLSRGTLPQIFGPTQFAAMSQASGAGPRSSAASSTMKQKRRRALKMSQSQRTSLVHYGIALISRYPCAPPLSRLSRTYTPWESFYGQFLFSRA